jgi:hypothetical protein
MKRACFLLAAALLATGLAVGCGQGGSNPFEGSWLSPDGATQVVFGSSSWSDSNGNRGRYDFTGVEPQYELTLTSQTGSQRLEAHFIDPNTLLLCPILPGGALGACRDLLKDAPALPGT